MGQDLTGWQVATSVAAAPVRPGRRASVARTRAEGVERARLVEADDLQLGEAVLEPHAAGRGVEVRHLRELYRVEVGHDLISRVTDAVLDDVREWQAPAAGGVYPILFPDAPIVKVGDAGAVRNKACYEAIGVNLEGERDVLGLWFQQAEGAKFWLAVFNELKQRGVQDVLICCVDGLKGFPEAIEAVFPYAWEQTCIVHLIRQSLRFVPDKHRRQVARDLKPISTAVDADAAAEALEQFAQSWGERYPMIGKTWREAWSTSSLPRLPDRRTPCRLHHQHDRGSAPADPQDNKTRGHLPTEEAARKLIYLSIINAQKELATNLQLKRRTAFVQIYFGDRLP